MDKQYDPKKYEEGVYKKWEKENCFKAEIDPDKKPFTILLPPPNANDSLHVGHALFTVEDILCRWHRMKGDPTLFLPGTDHAGIETQYVFEKKLQEKGKSRFDFDRDTLYEKIKEYVEKNRGIAKKQMKSLGFSLDWSRERYTLEPEILETVFDTFEKLHEDGLVYRGERIVNYCPHCGTAFSNLEVEHEERKDYLYHLDYGSVNVATTRPETIFADSAVAVNPEDPRFKNLEGGEAVIPLTEKKIPVVKDELVDQEFGTGALKVTPAHDETDFEIGQKHDLSFSKVVSLEGKMINVPKKYEGMRVLEARKAVVSDLEKEKKLIKKEPIKHTVKVCYRCKNLIEPLTMPQWFVKIKPLAEPAIEVVKSKDLEIFPERFKKIYLQWMEDIHDWNISRQIVWGPRIPAWYCVKCNPEILITFIDKEGKNHTDRLGSLLEKYKLEEIKNGLQSLVAPKNSSYSLEKGKCPQCGSEKTLQETDTFDTWFSSGQWPLTSLGFPDSEDFKYFYPTDVLDTMWDILFFWVARMVMLSLYRTGEIPFKVAHMHCRIVDEKGQKMSKSRGNVVNPLEIAEEYGTDALRMSLVFGTSPGGDISLGKDKFKAMRNFANKIWNASRFVSIMLERNEGEVNWEQPVGEEDKEILKKLDELIKEVDHQLENFRFGLALEEIYEFFWHDFCDEYLESSKERVEEALPILIEVLVETLKLLHPFAPFITEVIYDVFKEKLENEKLFDREFITVAKWPQPKSN